MNPADYPLALWPPSASASAAETDYIILAFTVLTLLLTVPIFIGIFWFALYYRDGRAVDREHREPRNAKIELSWMLIPFFLTLFFFVWGAALFDTHKHPPADALQVSAIGRQWMWKFEHPGGQGEINNLHVPVGQPVVINMISQDVIHSLYIPAMRLQMETLPDRYTQLWFNADRTGTYRLYCSEFCGSDHSNMDGLLTVMEPADYARWLQQAGSNQSEAGAGKALFESYGCSGCHDPGSTVHAPSLAGIYGRPVPLQAGGTVVADDTYIRDKILNPDEHKVAGYKQIMPSFKGVIPEDDLLRLIAYVKSLGPTSTGPGGRQTQ
ncbi:MAG: cytochrome c oxidase subunit II [Pseudomonadota bacterium]|nr:cytochrome c oxidase subunit II [Pseudomonadota bacterium]